MRIVLYVLCAIAAGIVLLYAGGFLYLSIDSKRPREAGLRGDRLRPCPGTPNCVLSEDKTDPFYIEPFRFSGETGTAWVNMKDAVIQLGGKIEKSSDSYLWATFRTKFWHFVDDLELRMDAGNKAIQVRSASRVGKGDMGMNRKRVEQLRVLFEKNQKDDRGD